ncbi:protease SohB [Candidatus Berkiella aquae]|uniref:Putative protease SohB n=2 Tax=Candidatus Berkiella aquae TaxID=295108 RepID=A0A0Q9YX16_9GAMM|nr:protease SohB [Candidatus Berkiella aquae]
MMEFLAQYGLFLAKTLTFVIAILVTLAGIVGILARSKKSADGSITIENVNEKMTDIRDSLQEETLPKHAISQWKKEQKKLQKAEKKKHKNTKTEKFLPRLFVVRFEGDMRASAVHGLRETISAIVEIAKTDDEVLVVLESPGGFVHSYGLAASQLQRLRARNIMLTAAIDKVAASGGYLMACVANKILSAPFAIVGSIGVVGQLPNFNRLLEKHNIDIEQHTAGEYKRTLTMLGKNTDKGRQKFQEELEETHRLFKSYIEQHRPIVPIQEVATGEHWYGTDALNLRLVDEIQTSDDYILAKIKTHDVFEIGYEEKQKLTEKITSSFSMLLNKLLAKLINPLT